LYRYFLNSLSNISGINNKLIYLKFKHISDKSSLIFSRFLSRSNNILKLLKDKKLYDIINTVNDKKLPFIFKLKDIDTFNKYNNVYYNTFIKETLKKEMLYLKYNQLLNTDANKFNSIYLSRLSKLISNMYGKKVEFNIINLKYMFLDSQILSESVLLKIRNRKNKIIKVLKRALKFKKFNRIKRYKYNIQNLYLNKYNMSDRYNNQLLSLHKKDALDYLLNKIFNVSSVIQKFDLNKNLYIYRSIRFRKIRGIKIEANGRLTKRLTASRSLSKFRYEGNLKNLDSSINNLSSVMLRGHLKSNIDYVNLNSKTRNGSFGIKG